MGSNWGGAQVTGPSTIEHLPSSQLKYPRIVDSILLYGATNGLSVIVISTSLLDVQRYSPLTTPIAVFPEKLPLLVLPLNVPPLLVIVFSTFLSTEDKSLFIFTVNECDIIFSFALLPGS
jgi:hypothetical protein